PLVRASSLLLLPPLSFTPPRPPRATLFPYTTLFRSVALGDPVGAGPAVLRAGNRVGVRGQQLVDDPLQHGAKDHQRAAVRGRRRSEEHTSELQSRFDIVCRLLLEKKNNNKLQYARDT